MSQDCVIADCPNLERFAAITVAGRLWSVNCARLYGRRNIGPYEILRESSRGLYQLNQPKALEAYILSIMTEMHEHVRALFSGCPHDFRKRIIWRTDGTIDKVRTYFAQTLDTRPIKLEDEACVPLYCSSHQAEMSPMSYLKMGKNVRVDLHHCRFIKSNEVAPFSVLSCAVRDGCFPAVKYFWSRIHPDGAAQLAVDCIELALGRISFSQKLDYSLIVHFLMKKLSHNHLESLISSHGLVIFKIYSVDWPLTCDFEKLERYIVHVDDATFRRVLEHLVNIAIVYLCEQRISMVGPNRSKRFALRIWRASSSAQKKSILSEGGRNLIRKLAMNNFTDLLWKIVDDEALEQRGRKVLLQQNETMFIDLMNNGRGHTCDEILTRLLPDCDERAELIAKILN